MNILHDGRYIVAMAAAFVLSCAAVAQPQTDYSVTWTSPGTSYKDSMPIGNGDIGLNLWTETNGDIVFLIAKTDAWTENGQLVKLGRVRLSIDGSPFKASPVFRQILRPKSGSIELRGESSAVMHVWVDANAPVIHVEMRGSQPVRLKASAELWRTEPRRTTSARGNVEMDNGLRELGGNPNKSVVIEPDTILPAVKNQLAWLHFNTRSIYPSVFDNQHLDSLLGAYPDPLLHRAFGVLMKGPGLASAGNQALESSAARNNFRLDLYALSTQTASPQDWRKAVEQMVARIDAVGLDIERAAHQRWWNEFWNRSWIHVSGDANAEVVTQGYAMQRWMTATESRGPAPMKFNGGIFTVGQEPLAGTPYDPEKGESTPDYRAWGSNYWFQNQRLLYWPMIASGDFDTLAPFYKMYLDALPLAKDRTAFIYKHDGAVFPETMYFWGLPNNNDFGWNRQQNDMASRWIRWHVNNGLELTTMMLDTWDVTRNRDFAVKTMLPLASEITTYFDRHWPRVAGKLHFDPSAALETRQSAVNPAPDIAGLMDVLPRLLALPDTLTTSTQRAMWKEMLADLPPLPVGRADDKGKSPQTSESASPTGAQILWPGEKFAKFENSENPELYSVFPFRIFGVNLPQLDLARATYDARAYKGSTCWGQDGIHAACLGWAARARDEAVANFSDYGGEKFKWFWKPGHDYEPDLDNGGAGQMILQSMLLQVRGDKLLLFPAWPKDWNVDFKLHAPMNTVVEGVYKNGKLEKLTVTPSTRAKDIVRADITPSEGK